MAKINANYEALYILKPDLNEEQIAALVERFKSVVARSEMVRHEFLDAAGRRQKTVFGDGTEVEIDLDKSSYTIRYAG